MRKLIILLFISTITSVSASETCSRVAQINFQNILVDANSQKKGEGLRFYLEKDPLALGHLNEYQENAKIQWHSALIGTLGTVLLLSGAVGNASSDSRQAMMISGGTMIAINYLVAKTFEMANEKNLLNAIEEYNKRNLPRIYFSPGSKNSKNTDKKVYLQKNWDF